MTIQFLKDHTTREGKHHRAGEVISVPDGIGTDLVNQGIAKERKEHQQPTERKSDDPEPDEAEADPKGGSKKE